MHVSKRAHLNGHYHATCVLIAYAEETAAHINGLAGPASSFDRASDCQTRGHWFEPHHQNFSITIRA